MSVLVLDNPSANQASTSVSLPYLEAIGRWNTGEEKLFNAIVAALRESCATGTREARSPDWRLILFRSTGSALAPSRRYVSLDLDEFE